MGAKLSIGAGQGFYSVYLVTRCVWCRSDRVEHRVVRSRLKSGALESLQENLTRFISSFSIFLLKKQEFRELVFDPKEVSLKMEDDSDLG